jgi:hypothetical protein
MSALVLSVPKVFSVVELGAAVVFVAYLSWLY